MKAVDYAFETRQAADMPATPLRLQNAFYRLHQALLQLPPGEVVLVIAPPDRRDVRHLSHMRGQVQKAMARRMDRFSASWDVRIDPDGQGVWIYRRGATQAGAADAGVSDQTAEAPAASPPSDSAADIPPASREMSRAGRFGSDSRAVISTMSAEEEARWAEQQRPRPEDDSSPEEDLPPLKACTCIDTGPAFSEAQGSWHQGDCPRHIHRWLLPSSTATGEYADVPCAGCIATKTMNPWAAEALERQQIPTINHRHPATEVKERSVKGQRLCPDCGGGYNSNKHRLCKEARATAAAAAASA